MTVPMGNVWDVAVIGAGSAGLAAALAAEQAGARVVLVEREECAGGVLPQCVHDGFGAHLYGEALTGPEYAERWSDAVHSSSVEAAFATTVLSVKPCVLPAAAGGDGSSPRDEGFQVDCVGNAVGSRASLFTRAVVMATGCRERTRGQLMVPGTRPAGVMTAGTAQQLMNMRNQLPGDKAVVLGSGDIGLIMARRLALEGAEVRMVLGQKATGLLRNHIRCIRDMELPIRYGWGVVRIHGKSRLSGVSIAPCGEDGAFDLSRREYLRCNLLLIACGLLPEREVANGLDAAFPGFFSCGNADVPCDLVDEVTQQGIATGHHAAVFALNARGVVVAPLSGELARIAGCAIAERKGSLADLGDAEADDRAISVCTECPKGCIIKLDEMTGAGCARGHAFAEQEAREPLRTFTGTVRVQGAIHPLISVKTDHAVPLSQIMSVAAATRCMRVKAPIRAGEVIAQDVAGTGAHLVATASRCACSAGSREEMTA